MELTPTLKMELTPTELKIIIRIIEEYLNENPLFYLTNEEALKELRNKLEEEADNESQRKRMVLS